MACMISTSEPVGLLSTRKFCGGVPKAVPTVSAPGATRPAGALTAQRCCACAGGGNAAIENVASTARAARTKKRARITPPARALPRPGGSSPQCEIRRGLGYKHEWFTEKGTTMPKRTLLAAAALIGLAGGLTLAAPATAMTNAFFYGTVDHVSTDNIKVTDPQTGQSLSFMLVPKFKNVTSD